VDWLDKFQALVAADLEQDLRDSFRAHGIAASVAVNSALLHGNPFQAWPLNWQHVEGRTVEIGDLLLLGEQHNSNTLMHREALLLQMKVGKPSLVGPLRNEKAQAEFYASWPEFNWSGKLRRTLPGPFPRKPESASRAAARFAIVPEGDFPPWSTCEAFQVEVGPSFGALTPLHHLMARVARMGLGVNATPNPKQPRGWARVVQDILDAAPGYTFRGQNRFSAPAGSAAGGADEIGLVTDETHRPRAGFAVVQIGLGPQGRFD
jgi:hypothetical protein